MLRLLGPARRPSTPDPPISLGKLVADHLYAHASLIPELPEPVRALVVAAESVAGGRLPRWNTVKVHLGGEAVSFLEYADFEEAPFPELRRGVKVDLLNRTAQERSYDPAGNPPILHRKETLLPPARPGWVQFAALTFACEEAGLFDDPTAIGTREVAACPAGGWLPPGRASPRARRRRIGTGDPTAPHRDPPAYLSTPVQALLRHGFLDGRKAVFDYGCGRGDGKIGDRARLGTDTAGITWARLGTDTAGITLKGELGSDTERTQRSPSRVRRDGRGSMVFGVDGFQGGWFFVG
jgi:hypothetical protein